MFTSSVIFAMVALTQLAVASIPACFIDVLGAQSNPADLKAICGKNQHDVMTMLCDKCKSSDDKTAAISVFASSCLEQVSMTISTETSMYTSAPTSSSTTSYDSKSTETSTKSSGGDSYTASSKSYPTAISTKSYSPTAPTALVPKPTSGSSHNRPLTVAVLVLAGVISRLLL